MKFIVGREHSSRRIITTTTSIVKCSREIWIRFIVNLNRKRFSLAFDMTNKFFTEKLTELEGSDSPAVTFRRNRSIELLLLLLFRVEFCSKKNKFLRNKVEYFCTLYLKNFEKPLILLELSIVLVKAIFLVFQSPLSIEHFLYKVNKYRIVNRPIL